LIPAAPGLFGWPSQGGSQPDDRDFVFEDPFVWWDGSKNRWNLLCHQYNMTDAAHQYLDGGFAVSNSEDLWGGWSWGAWEQPAYTALVNYTNGSSDVMTRRERPFVLFGSDGKPEVLYTAVSPPGDTHNTNCYTIANPLKPVLPVV
jgi:hypothetical protein